MDKLKLAILIIVVCLLTVFTSVNRPVMHKQFMITDSELSFVEEDNTNRPEIVYEKPQTAAVNEDSAKNVKQTVKNVKNQPQNQIQKPQTTSQRKTQTKIQRQVPAKPASKSKSAPVTKPSAKPAIKQEKPKIKEESKPQKTVVRQLTEREEIIAWNKWRSDLQNQVMKDTKISAPLGTGFKFSFTVDKFGNMSNIKVWSTNPVYSNLAVKVIKPVLSSYQGKQILTFPEGTKRIITNVNGGFVMSRQTGYSTPDDYSDYERVKR